jgi:pimeloyl-ACP methyl ester carboxylesterase
MSRFGYLRTPMPGDASPAAQADAHASLLDAIGIERTAIIGVSAGATSALQFALRHPGRCAALVLLVPALYVPRPHGAPSIAISRATRTLAETVLRSDFLYWSAMRLAPRAVVRSGLATLPAVYGGANADERARVQAVMELALPVTRRRAGVLNDAAVVAALAREPLERVACPTLTLSVGDDLFGTYEIARYTAEQVPEGRFIGFEKGGHVWIGHHAAIMAAIAAFLHRDARFAG